MQALSKVNPVTYGVDAIARYAEDGSAWRWQVEFSNRGLSRSATGPTTTGHSYDRGNTYPGGTVIIVESGTFSLYNDACAVTTVAAGRGIVGGRISVGGIGYLTRDGQPAGRLATLPLAGTLPAFLAGIISVGEDARVVPDRAVLAPTVLWRYR